MKSIKGAMEKGEGEREEKKDIDGARVGEVGGVRATLSGIVGVVKVGEAIHRSKLTTQINELQQRRRREEEVEDRYITYDTQLYSSP